MPQLEIIGVPLSNYVRSVRMLCEEKGVPYSLVPEVPHSPAVMAINPVGQIPCMRHGAVELFESQAIAAYIDRTFPGPKFFPADEAAYAKTLQWISYGNVKVDRWLMREFVVPIVFADKNKGPDQQRIAAAQPEIGKSLAILDAAVGPTGFLVGNDLTYADINVLPMLIILGMFPQGKEHLAKFPALETYIANLSSRPSYVRIAPPSPPSPGR
jgi:glutathione S-transferase